MMLKNSLNWVCKKLKTGLVVGSHVTIDLFKETYDKMKE